MAIFIIFGARNIFGKLFPSILKTLRIFNVIFVKVLYFKIRILFDVTNFLCFVYLKP